MEAEDIDLDKKQVVEVEDLYVSDSEETAFIVKEDIPLNIDSNSRLSSKASNDLDGFHENESSSASFQTSRRDLFEDTSSEELEMSDEDSAGSAALTLKKVDLDGIASVDGVRHESASLGFNYSSDLFKDECLTDAEYMSEDDTTDELKPYRGLINPSARRLSGGLSIAGLVSTVKDALVSNRNPFSSSNIATSFSSSILLRNNIAPSDCSDSDTPLMSCLEFLKSDNRDGGDTDEEEFPMESLDNKGHVRQPARKLADLFQNGPCFSPSNAMYDNLRFRGTGSEARRSSMTIELLSDEDTVYEDDRLIATQNKMKARHNKKHSNADDCLTDEETFDLETKEWTETDESGCVRQVTHIKTETSIKLEGDGDGSALDGDGLVGTTTTTTTTRVVTSVVSDPDNPSEIESTFVQHLSDDDVKQSYEVTFNSSHKPDESGYDE